MSLSAGIEDLPLQEKACPQVVVGSNALDLPAQVLLNWSPFKGNVSGGRNHV